MQRFVPALAAAAVAVALGSAPSMAGPLEDGVKAYSRAQYSTALRILQPLADQGNVDAQYTIAQMYSRGDGVNEDKVKAYMWLALAARDGDKDAAADRDQLGNDLKPEQLDQAKSLAAQWKAK